MNIIKQNYRIVKNDDNLIKNLLIGFLVLISSFLILPLFLYQGYLMRILKRTESENKLPKWDGILNLLYLGFIGIFISLLIQIPIQILYYTPILLELGGLIVLLVSLLTFGLSLISSYFMIAILTVIARDGLGEITNISRITNICLSSEFLIAQISVFLLNLVSMIFLMILVLITLGLGIVLVPFILIFLNFLSAFIFGNTITQIENN